MRITKLVAYILFCCPFIVSAQDAQPFSLQEAIEYAKLNHPDVKVKILNIEDAEQQIIENRAIGIPQVNAGMDYQYFVDIPTQILPDFISPTVYAILEAEDLITDPMPPIPQSVPAQFGTKHNLSANLNVSALIFDGSYFVGLKAAREYREFTDAELQNTIADVRINVINSYLPILILDETATTIRKNIEKITSVYEETKAYYEEGFVERLDVDRLELSIANLETELEAVEIQRSTATNALKFAMGYPIEGNIELTDDMESVLNNSIGDELAMAKLDYNLRPDYVLANEGIQLNELNIKLQKSSFLPSIGAFGSYQQSLLTNDLSNGEWYPTTVLGLNLNVPIFSGLGKKAKVSRAEIDLQQSIEQLNYLESAISLEVENARSTYLNARKRLENRKKNMDLAERIYNTTQTKYSEGVGSSLEVNQAEQDVYTAQQNYYQAVFDVLTAESALAKALGK